MNIGGITMKSFAAIIIGLVIGFLVFACSQQPSRQAEPGWVMLIDGPNGLENWNRIGSSNWAVVE